MATYSLSYISEIVGGGDSMDSRCLAEKGDHGAAGLSLRHIYAKLKEDRI